MKYEAPELIEIGSAATLVLGAYTFSSDCCGCSGKTKEPMDIDEIEA
jgi:hypothetical protein